MEEMKAEQERPTFANNRRQQQMIEQLHKQLDILREKLNPYIGPDLSTLKESNEKDPDNKSTAEYSQFEQEQRETITLIDECIGKVSKLNRSLKL